MITNYLKKYPLSLLTIITIWILCLIRIPETPVSQVPFIDKWTHFTMYGGLCTIIWLEYLRYHPKIHPAKVILYALIAPIIMSGLIELAQAYCTTCRSGDWLDFAANTVGVLLGNVIGFIGLKWIIRPKKGFRN